MRCFSRSTASSSSRRVWAQVGVFVVLGLPMTAAESARIIGFPGGHVEGFPDTFRALFSQVYEDVRRGEPSETPNYPTFADGHDAVLVTDAIARSHQEERWVTVQR